MLSRFEKFICDINQIDLFWHRLSASEMKRYGLKGNYAIYFTRLHSHPEGLTAAQLAALCGKDKADVSRDLPVLEQARFVRRDWIGGSRYRALIFLTAEGNRLTEEIICKAEQAVDFVGSGLSDLEREYFYRVLDLITKNLHTLSETGLPEAK